MNPFSEQEWQRAADFILPVLLGEPTANGGMTHTHFWKATAECGLMAADMPPGKWRDTYYALARLILTEQAVHHVILARELAGKVSDDDLTIWIVAYGENSTLRGEVFESNVRALKEYGERARLLRELSEMQANLKRGLPMDDLVASMVTTLTTADTGTSVAPTLTEFMTVKPDKLLFTGIKLLDTWLKGLSPDALVTLVGRMKQRKTSLMLNILLNLALNGHSVALLMFENTAMKTRLHLAAILAVRYLIEQDLFGHGVIGTDGLLLDQISAEDLYKSRGHIQERWDKQRLEAVNYAVATVDALKPLFRVYDRTLAGGSLSDHKSVLRTALRDKALYGAEVIAIDHVQRIRVENARSDYEKLSVVAPFIEELARVHQICTFALSQRNAEENNDDNYRSGARGGLALDEASDYVLRTGYKIPITKSKRKNVPQMRLSDTELAVSTHLSRWGKDTVDTIWALDIDPASGLVLKGGEGHKVWLE